ncbi:MAG: hypothetical protein GY820_31270 [Gammaproteobacteria bacterium]|nr:hypothetical protein [Gammaproteobacteria bacterium]
MKITLTHSPDSSRLHSAEDTTNFFLEVINCELIVQRYSLNVDLAQEVVRRLKLGEDVPYNFNRFATHHFVSWFSL